MTGWIVAFTMFIGWMITAYRAGSAMLILKQTIATLADKALDSENAKKLKDELEIK